MTAVYPLLNHTDNNYKELRYSLRSLEQFNPVDQVIIVGGRPQWIHNVCHIPHKDYPTPSKAKNIYDKVCTAFGVADELLFLNDDHFILAPVDYLHHKGPLIDNINSRDRFGSYTRTMVNTYAVFGEVMDYDTHCPIVYRKEGFELLKRLDWNLEWGHCIKTSYCCLNELTGTYYPDLKFDRTIGDITGRMYFTTDDGCNLSKLEEIYPVKSKYEL